MSDYLKLIDESLQEASRLARSYFGKVSSTIKDGDSSQVLTEADLAVGKFLVEAIQQRFPDHNIIDEETGFNDKGSRYTWVIDPIDGTSNFAAGLTQYGILLGLMEGDEPIAGGMALPGFDEIYLAEKGGGATLNSSPMHVSQEKELINSLVAYMIDADYGNPEATREETKVLAEIILNIRNLRISNSAYDLAQVAKGSYGGVVSKCGKIWDYVAPVIILQEAGAVVTDYSGNKLDLSNPMQRGDQEFTCCIAPPELHERLQAIING